MSSALVFAQVNGRITGTVVDPTGAPIPGVAVEVRVPDGAQAILSTETNSEGLFTFPALRPATYDLLVSKPGFAKYSNRRVKVDPLVEVSLGLVRLEVASTEQVIEVSAEVQAVQLTNSELTTTITRDQIQNLPAFGRQVSTLFNTQAGVSSGRGPTVINGLRTSAANVTLDGINIQDNFIRTNSLDFMPIRPTIEQISDMTVAVANAGTTIGGGAAQISLSTRSGSNDYHGSLYWYNRNSAVSANEFFNNRAGVEVPFLNLNQPGGSLGGRIIRDKLFFFANYEEYRLKQQSTQLNTVLTPSARQGIFGCARCSASTSLLAARGISIDPAISALLQQLPEPNSTDTGDGINTSGYRFNARENGFRRQAVGRGDYYLSPSHSFTATYNYTKETNDRPDITDQFFTPIPPNGTDTDRHFLSTGWRWTASPTFTNEVRAGFLRSPSKFTATGTPAVHIGNTIFTNPVNDFMPQGRFTNTYSMQDNASWLKGKHEFSFGFQTQLIRIQPYNDAGIVPTLDLGISSRNATGFTTANLPGATSGDVNQANALYSTLGGIVSSAVQSYNVTSRTSGFVPGAGEVRNFSYDTWSGYLQDRWKVRPGLTLTLGLRYEYWTVLKERDNLWLLPALKNGNVIETLLDPLAQFDFVGVGGRTMYKPDRNNFAPTLSFAWDPFGNGKTAIRGGYSISFFNDDAVTAIRNNANTNSGLNQDSNLVGLAGVTVSGGVPIPTPAFQVPRTQADNYDASPTAALGSPDPNLKTPYVQQWTIGVQHEISRNIIEVRYVGNHATQLLRAFDYNQVVIKENGFLDDFVRARNNGFASLAATGRYAPSYTGPGTQPLTVFPQLPGGGLLTNATVINNILQGNAGELGTIYQTNGLNGPVDFFRNPNALGANVINSGGNSTYHALQMDVRRRLSDGVNIQGNYTFGKVLSDNTGDAQSRFDPYLDLGNPSLERARAPFDLTHAIKFNGSYELPFGKGKRWSAGSGVVNQIFGGWIVAGIMQWQSGFPFSVLSNRGTLNRGGRSTNKNTATTLVTKSEIDSRFGVRKDGDGVYLIDRATINTDRRGVNSDTAAPYAGQLFFNPGPGAVGALQRRMFSGPWAFSMDMSLLKRFYIREKDYLELRANAYNVGNHPTFSFGDQNINSTAFGRLTSTLSDARVWEFGLYYRF
ncbi:MAG: TonB-dependent receptor [Bryobacteraceae bacterium]